jgi:hypothetical protein
MLLGSRGLPSRDITTSRTSSLLTEKILEEKRVYSTLFFHQEKSFQDHCLSLILSCDPVSRERAEESGTPLTKWQHGASGRPKFSAI